ncbi:hypothetical protein sphantq_00332 [Sphingobium sp. AntQ-1]|uniref:hypothetical protein n=1 Tax=Sphingobium sp. AntQ-1 TaxID=2930091 RepID=UPI00234E6C17|nr:hypothetical protein [Sphingobium sp. AntQ-1]WCP11937.1 hypothetical protein sphantq_00332 [Sphingobium sp. AntQ-1]
MKQVTMLLAAAISCILGSCDNPQYSLVGDWEIAPDSKLAEEHIILFFRKENGTYYPATLSYSLSPSGLLSIEKGRDHAVCCFGGIDKHFADLRQKTQLSKEKQFLIRRMLARLRPRVLSSDVPFALPQGCSFTFDSRSWNSVGFSRGKAAGAFIFQPDCEGLGADKAKHLLRSVVAALPPVEGSMAFLEGH